MAKAFSKLALLLFAIPLFSGIAQAQNIRKIEISPSTTQAEVRQVRGPHVALLDPTVVSSGYLLISLGGTGSKPDDFRHVHKVALQLGHKVIGVDYTNEVISTRCRQSPSPSCFENFRREISFGIPGSDFAEVDGDNSIVNRIHQLLRFLTDRDPVSWQSFLDGSSVNWDKVILIGHSQGSGHAAYMSKFLPVKRLVLFAGPQDATDAGTADWLTKATATDPSKIFAFLHAGDFFDVNLQLQVSQKLHMGRSLEIAEIDSTTEVPLASVIVTTEKQNDGHNAVLYPPYENVWKRLLQLEE